MFVRTSLVWLWRPLSYAAQYWDVHAREHDYFISQPTLEIVKDERIAQFIRIAHFYVYRDWHCQNMLQHDREVLTEGHLRWQRISRLGIDVMWYHDDEG